MFLETDLRYHSSIIECRVFLQKHLNFCFCVTAESHLGSTFNNPFRIMSVGPQQEISTQNSAQQ